MDSSALSKFTVPQMPLETRSHLLATFNASYLHDIPAALHQWSCSRTILVVSRALNANTDYISKLESLLGDAIVGKKTGVGAHTPYADVLEITKLLQDNNADSLVCIGSSSYSDACKTARLLAGKLPPDQVSAQGIESLVDPATGSTARGIFDPPKIKLILVPCSLSVSEYNPVSSATNSSGKKQHFGEFKFDAGGPNLVLLDPEVAGTAPADALWIPSGVRAIDHCVESLVSKAISAQGDVVAEKALRSLVHGLRTYKQGLVEGKTTKDEEMLRGISLCQQGAREAIMGIFCYGTHMGPSHAIGHQLGSVGRVAHGHTSCICLAPTLRYEKKHPENPHWVVEKQQIVLDIFNEATGWHETDAADAVERFVRDLGMPTRLSDVGVTEDAKIQQIAEQTMTDIWGGGPKQLDDPASVVSILNVVR